MTQWGDSTCVACGECVQACPTGALMPASIVDKDGVGHSKVDKKIDSVCPYCGVGCQIEYNVKDNKINHRLNFYKVEDKKNYKNFLSFLKAKYL